jgi:hypothetical protein
MSSNANPLSSPTRVILDRITEVAKTDSGNAYFAAYFKAGLFGRSTRRAFFGTPQPDGSINWERVSPAELKPLVGQDLSGQVSVEPIDIEPREITLKTTGEILTMTTATIVKLADETIEAAARVYRYELRKQQAEVLPIAPAGFHLVAGDGAA